MGGGRDLGRKRLIDPESTFSLTKGHIGGTFFEIIVEAENTLYLVCNYTVYGQKPFTRAQRVRFPKKRRKDEL